jgi:SAM-dependent methyltransferase
MTSKTINYSKSLMDFLTQDVSRFVDFNEKKNILEIGCASYSVFEDLSFNGSVLAIDINVQKINQSPKSKIDYVHKSIVNFNVPNAFDLVFDSHAIHCILNEKDRKKSLLNIYSALKDNGVLCSEIMISKNTDDSHFYFPERLVKSAIEVENELIEIGFKIKYFMIKNDFYFSPSEDSEIKCDLLRFVALK